MSNYPPGVSNGDALILEELRRIREALETLASTAALPPPPAFRIEPWPGSAT